MIFSFVFGNYQPAIPNPQFLVIMGGVQDWKKYSIFIKDGGNCYFNLKINLATRQYYELRVNVEA